MRRGHTKTASAAATEAAPDVPTAVVKQEASAAAAAAPPLCLFLDIIAILLGQGSRKKTILRWRALVNAMVATWRGFRAHGP